MKPTDSSQTIFEPGSLDLEAASRARRLAASLCRHGVAGFLGIVILYLSLVTTSAPMRAGETQTIERAIAVLDAKGFQREAFLLRHAATFRGSDNWLNGYAGSENAYASTNFPFGIITIYPDFYTKAVDDTERAMILLHEAQHLRGGNETDAYTYVWRNRDRLGWTQLTHGTTEAYITIEQQTRENAPDLFNCSGKLWRDCTETTQLSVVGRQSSDRR